MKRIIIVFDFDGTITKSDSFIAFIRYSCGIVSLLIGLIIFSPMLLLYKLHLYPNWRAKQRLFKYFFGGMSFSDFSNLGVGFIDKIEKMVRPMALEYIAGHISSDHCIYVVSASVEEWIKPWCKKHGLENIIGTKIEVVDNVVTGRFLTRNCYGEEKINRFLREEPYRNEYYLIAYGDSHGDDEMINFADEGYYCKFE